MPIELKKEMLSRREVIIRTGCEAFTDIDIIVPDVKPDIVRILQIDANPVIMEKTIYEEKLLFDCCMDICILYAAEGGCVKSIKTRHNFSHQVNNKSITKDLCVTAYCCLARLDYRVVNSRKLSIGTTVAIDYCLYREGELPLVTGFESDGCQARYSQVKAYAACRQTVTEISVRETFDIPRGKPDADELLRMNVHLSNKEIRRAGNKAVVKGDMICSLLYVCDIEPSSLQTAEYAMPFTEVIDLPEAEDGMLCNIDFIYKTVNCSVKQDGDGDNRIVYAEIYMDAVANSGCTTVINTVDDVYSTDCGLEVKYDTVQLEELVGESHSRENVKCNAPLPEGLPEITGVFDVSAVPGTVTAGLDGGRIIVEGELIADILYKTADPDMPVCSFKHTMPFTCSFDMEGADDKTMFDVNIDIDSVGYNINLPDELELRCIVSVHVSGIRPNTVRCITAVEEHDLPEAESCGAYCIRIYYVRRGDTLWDIAKKYRVSISRLMKANNLDETSVLVPGQRLMIP